MQAPNRNSTTEINFIITDHPSSLRLQFHLHSKSELLSLHDKDLGIITLDSAEVDNSTNSTVANLFRTLKGLSKHCQNDSLAKAALSRIIQELLAAKIDDSEANISHMI